MELRIYYECLEQAYNYIQPIMSEVAKDQSIQIKLIKRAKNRNEFTNGVLKAIYSMTTPDILITACDDNFEYPLSIIEFTEAVVTEDHELQRVYGALAAFLAKTIYIKISPEKESTKDHGGAEYNPYSTPKIFLEKFGYKGFFICKWETLENSTVVKRNVNHPACPEMIPLLKLVITEICSAFCKEKSKWYAAAIDKICSNELYDDYFQKISKADGKNELLGLWKKRQNNSKNKNRIRFFITDKEIRVKIYRFSHSMDPDRGIIMFISSVWGDDYDIYGIYSVERNRAGDVLKGKVRSLRNLQDKFKAALSKDKNGITNSWFEKILMENVNTAIQLNQEFDIGKAIDSNIVNISDNKVIQTLIFFLDGLFIGVNGILFKWKRNNILPIDKKNLVSSLSKVLEFDIKSTITPIELVTKTVDEDEVTYVMAHRILIPNGFNIIAISYPGSQGSVALLPEINKGRSQKREYPDIIASINEGNEVILNESKPKFNVQQLQKDINKLEKYKTVTKKKKVLDTLLLKTKAIKDGQEYNLNIGVSFGCNKKNTTSWKPATIDFILRVIDRDKWSIGIFRQILRDKIEKIEGKTDFPVVYKIKK